METIRRNRFVSLVLIFALAFSVLFTCKRDLSANSGVDDFVKRCYSVTFGREPDEGGFEYWKGRIVNGELVGSTTVYFFVFSPEYAALNRSDKDYVKDLYTMFMGREPDQDGYDYWCGQMKSGMSRENVFAGFANSPEFSEICTGYGITAGFFTDAYPVQNVNDVNLFVERLFKTCLGRLGDQGGQSYWTSGLLAGSLDGVSCAANFIFSEEYRGMNLSNEDYIKNLYVGFMNREADQGGLDYWLGLMNDGTPRGKVFEGFANSAEFAQICASYGINPGTYTYDPATDPDNGVTPTAVPSAKPTDSILPTVDVPITAVPTESQDIVEPVPSLIAPTGTITITPCSEKQMNQTFYAVLEENAGEIGPAENFKFYNGSVAVVDLNGDGNKELLVMRAQRMNPKSNYSHIELYAYGFTATGLKETDVCLAYSIADGETSFDLVKYSDNEIIVRHYVRGETSVDIYTCYKVDSDLNFTQIDTFKKDYSNVTKESKFTHNDAEITENEFSSLSAKYIKQHADYVYKDRYIHSDEAEIVQAAKTFGYYESLWRSDAGQMLPDIGLLTGIRGFCFLKINKDGSYVVCNQMTYGRAPGCCYFGGKISKIEWTDDHTCELTIGSCNYLYEDGYRVPASEAIGQAGLTVNNKLNEGLSFFEVGSKITLYYPNLEMYDNEFSTSTWSSMPNGYTYVVKASGDVLFR